LKVFLCGPVRDDDNFAPSAAVSHALYPDSAAEPSIATIVAPCSGIHLHSSVTRDAWDEISVRSLSADTASDGDGACGASLLCGFALDLLVAV